MSAAGVSHKPPTPPTRPRLSSLTLSSRAASEAIAAGRLLTPAGSPPVHVLLHTRVSPASLELRCKTPDAGLSAAILAGIAARLG